MTNDQPIVLLLEQSQHHLFDELFEEDKINVYCIELHKDGKYKLLCEWKPYNNSETSNLEGTE